ncbi:MAG: hypothetical protein R6V05_13005 [Candidatus Brocadiia bacterium]
MMVALLCARPIGLPATAEEGAPEEVDLDAVLEAIRARQARLRSFTYEVRCSQQHTEHAEYSPELRSKPWQSGYTLTMDGDKIRLQDNKEVVFNQVSGQLEHMVSDNVAVQGVVTSYNPPNQIGGNSGIIDAGLNAIVSHPHFQPLIEAHRLFRPLSIVSPRAEDIRPVGRVEHNGHPCVIVEEREHKYGHAYVHEWWLAQDMEYCPLVSRFAIDNRILGHTEVRYAPHREVGWKVDSFKDTNWNDRGQVTYVISGTVERAEMNPHVPPETFHLEFPPGTRVYNRFTDTRYTVGGETPIQGDVNLVLDGRLEEFARRMEEKGLMPTMETGGPNLWLWGLGGLCAGVVLAGAAYLWRRRSRR